MRNFRRVVIASLVIALCAAFALAQRRGRVRSGNQTRQAATTTTTAAAAPAAAWEVTSVDKMEAARGDTVTVSGVFPKKPVTIEVSMTRIPEPILTAAAPGASPTPTPVATPSPAPTPVKAAGKVVEDEKSFSFIVPGAARLGKYNLAVTFNKGASVTANTNANANSAAPASANANTNANTSTGAAASRAATVAFPENISGYFKVISTGPIRITSVYPSVSYFTEVGGKKNFTFTVLGEGFSPYPEDNALMIKGMPRCYENSPPWECGRVEVRDGGRELKFIDIPSEKLSGPLDVQVRVGDRMSENSMRATLSRVSRWYPRYWGLGAVAVLGGLIWFLLRGARRWGRAARYTNTRWDAIFLDRQTNTYSLSKLQFYLWTAAAIFGYVYLTAAKSLIRGELEFAQIPENLPGILLISAGTSALATGIHSSKGSKGAGQMAPSRADFITTGGVVAAERVQFLAWTVLGVAAFIFFIVVTDPGLLQELPKLPEGLLYLSGISSFGYLGGKLARKPGPVIRIIDILFGSVILVIRGSNLSPNATFKINDVELKAEDLDGKVNPNGLPAVESTDDDNTEFAKVLRLKIVRFKGVDLRGFGMQQSGETTIDSLDEKQRKTLLQLFGKNPKLTIINPDGQRAEWEYKVSEEAAADAAAGGAEGQLTTESTETELG